jgi:hypothetical protein
LGAICFWRRGAAPYAVAASLSVLLCLDDILLLHDDVYPRLGVDELAASAVYMLVYLVYVLLARAVTVQLGAGSSSHGVPAMSWRRTSRGSRPCLAAVDR